jgi:hypothetical protein
MIGFVEYARTVIKTTKGRSKTIIDDKPTCLTIRPVAGEDGEEIEYAGEKMLLDQGEFIVSSNAHNLEKLSRMCKRDQIEMRDLDLHYEFLNADFTKKEVDQVGDLTNIKCLKVKRNDVLTGLMEVGITSMEALSNTRIATLTQVDGVAIKTAGKLIEEAKEWIANESGSPDIGSDITQED